MKTSQKEIILKLLKEDPNRKWLTYELQKSQTKYGWLGTQADKRCRELREEGLIKSEPQGRYERFWYAPDETKWRKIEYFVPALTKTITKYEKI